MSNFIGNNTILNENAPVEYYWDANGNTAGTGGTGNFDTTSLVFRKSSSTGPLVSYSNNNINYKTIIFDGTSGIVTLSQATYVDKIKFLVSNYILSSSMSNTILGNKNNTFEIYVDPLVATGICTLIPSFNKLIKTGEGAFIWSRDQTTITNGIFIVSGSIMYTSGNNLEYTNIDISSGASFEIATYGTTPNRFYGNFSGSGIIRRSTPYYAPYGSVFIQGNNINFTGSWQFNSGSDYVAFTNDNAVGAPGVNISCSGASAGFYFTTSGNTLASTRTITLSGNCNLFWNGFQNNTNTIGSLITGVGSITKQSYETHILTNNNTYNGATYVRGVGSTAGAAEAVLRVSSGSLGGTAGQTGDFGNIVFQDNGTNGILEFVTAANLGVCSQIRFRNTPGVVGYGGALRYIGSTNETVNKTIQCDTGIGIRLESNSTGAGSITYNGTFSQTNRGLYLAGTGIGILNNVFSGTGSVNKRGSGSWTLGGNNTYSGGTNITAGTLIAGSSTAFGTGTITISSGATLNLNGFTVSNTIVNNGGTVIP